MFEKTSMMYLYVETPLHAGSGRAVGVVDLPIQRERVTNYPLVQSSGMKGRLRAEVYAAVEAEATAQNPRGENDTDEGYKKRIKQLVNQTVEPIFGPEQVTSDDSAYAGALSVGDARLLLFPVRSLFGVFAWATSANVLARYIRDLAACGLDSSTLPDPGKLQPDTGEALVAENSALAERGRMVLEEFSYTANSKAEVATLGSYLATHVLPSPAPEYQYWRDNLAKHLVVLSENDFRDFTTYATEVVTRVRLDDDTKTVARGALWTEESLPSDTLLYCPLYAAKARNGANMDAATVLSTLSGRLSVARIRLGGDETVGRGSVALRFAEGR